MLVRLDSWWIDIEEGSCFFYINAPVITAIKKMDWTEIKMECVCEDVIAILIAYAMI